MSKYDSAVFGNRGGSHQLLSSSLPASAPVLDALRFLVDRPAGHGGAGGTWSPYLGCPPPGRWWGVLRGGGGGGGGGKRTLVPRERTWLRRESRSFQWSNARPSEISRSCSPRLGTMALDWATAMSHSPVRS